MRWRLFENTAGSASYRVGQGEQIFSARGAPAARMAKQARQADRNNDILKLNTIRAMLAQSMRAMCIPLNLRRLSPSNRAGPAPDARPSLFPMSCLIYFCDTEDGV
ncbi:hypothetical protein DN745_17930 [Bradymonas sediminis]|uniref:Uncharacterized protein n=1 Tax=Bradymonas sediminis TaxID=1548548 RepID=A0A2Z4FR60_9DELT|nr:hypothetical protein DN745_17930 [Bradymonas sediminis]